MRPTSPLQAPTRQEMGHDFKIPVLIAIATNLGGMLLTVLVVALTGAAWLAIPLSAFIIANSILTAAIWITTGARTSRP